jgi:hypothetical protein
VTSKLDDHLDLLGRDLSDRRLVVFSGMSGSGKSTYLSLLLDRHPDFVGRAFDRLFPAPIDWLNVRPAAELVVIDELQSVTELTGVARLLRAGHTLLAASHLPTAWVRLFGLRWPAMTFRTDQSAVKLERHLESRGFSFTPVAVRRFVSLYGANYVDLDIILERAKHTNFDRALTYFERYNRIDLSAPGRS